MALGWCARSELSERLCQVNLLETQKSRATNGEMSLGCHVYSCVHRFPGAACAHFDRLIHKFLMNTRLIRLYVRPYAAHVPLCVCVCARARTFIRPRANSSGSYLSYLFTRPSALSFIGTDYTADLPPSCQILRPGSCSGRIRGAFLMFVTQFCRSRSPRMSSFLCSLSRLPSQSFLFSPASNRCLSRESRSSWLPWLPTGRSLAHNLSLSIPVSHASPVSTYSSPSIFVCGPLYSRLSFSPRSVPPRSHDPLR